MKNLSLKKSLIQYFILIWTLMFTSINAKEQIVKSDEQIKAEVVAFFDVYLDTYNQRFGHPDKASKFIDSLSSLIHTPFLMSPPNTLPFYPKNSDQMTSVFDGFVRSLEAKKAVKLKWGKVSLKVLSPNKVLANNAGFAIDSKGNKVYETTSIYLVVQVDGHWKIALFSPYELSREWSF